MKRFIIASLVLIVLAAVATSAWGYRELTTPIAHNKSGQYVDIPKGSSPTAVVNTLASQGILRHSWPLMFYLKLTGRSATLKAGEYKFPSPISPMGVYAKLRQGERRLNRFTVIEGWTRWDIANALAAVPELKLTDSSQALELMNNVKLISDLDPKAKNLEGYLYPDTYEFAPESTPEQLIEMMVKRFKTVWQPDWTSKALAMNLSPRQIVTVASLIETEAKLEDERPLVASVIYNRIKKDIPLGVDSSLIYASKLAGKWRNDGKVYLSDVNRVSPYNTRLVPGLPPGPISSPGKSSLEAALNPATTNYLYYVREPSRNDGAHNFYDNPQDFARGVQALREWERARDAAVKAANNAMSN